MAPLDSVIERARRLGTALVVGEGGDAVRGQTPRAATVGVAEGGNSALLPAPSARTAVRERRLIGCGHAATQGPSVLLLGTQSSPRGQSVRDYDSGGSGQLCIASRQEEVAYANVKVDGDVTLKVQTNSGATVSGRFVVQGLHACTARFLWRLWCNSCS